MTLEDFEKLLDSHRWLWNYEYSDDSDEYWKGRRSEERIENALTDNENDPRFRELYNKHYNKYHTTFSGR